MDLQLQDKIVLITGATGGIGRAIVARFLQEGAQPVAVYRNEKKYGELREWLERLSCDMAKLHGVKGDVLSSEGVDKIVQEALRINGRIDVLVNCAGASIETPFALMTDEQIDETIALNFRSPMRIAQAVLKPMFRQKEGSIIMISSLTAIRKGRGVAVYAAAKAGLDTFCRSLAQEVGKKNIRVNSIRPGLIETEMSASLVERTGNMLRDDASLNRFGKPDEVAAAVVFLASAASASFITGTQLNVDGGLYL